MLISGKEYIFDIEKITYIHKTDTFIDITCAEENSVISYKSPDYNLFDTLFFSGGVPDKIISGETLLNQLSLIKKITELNTLAGEHSLRIRIHEESEQNARTTAALEQIDKIGLENYRDKVRNGYSSAMNNPSGFNLKQ
jgi:hypothetical protein